MDRKLLHIFWYEFTNLFSKKRILGLVILFWFLLYLSIQWVSLFVYIYVGNTGFRSMLFSTYTVFAVVLPLFALLFVTYSLSNELERKTSHFLVTSANRVLYVLGKFLAQICSLGIIMLIGFFAVLIYLYTKIHIWYVTEMLYLFVMMFMYTITFVSIFVLLAVFTMRVQRTMQLGCFLLLLFYTMAIIPALNMYSPLWYAFVGLSQTHMALLFFVAVICTTIGGALIMFERKAL